MMDYNISDIKEFAKTQLKKHELDGEWNFMFDNAKRRLGVCKHGKKVISISKNYIGLLTFDEIKDVILHEIAHALVGNCHGHNYVWKSKAIEIGCDGERLYNGEASVKHKYKGVCPTCGRVIKRHRRKRISCSRCSSVFNIKHLFVWELND